MNRFWNRWKIEWRSTPLDRKIELFLITGGMLVAGFVMINSCHQLEQMSTQTTAMQGQLAEMRSGAADTKAMAEAAKTQANNTMKLADAAAASTSPWLVTVKWGYKGFEKDRPNVMLSKFGIKNVGKTSAIETEIGSDFIFIEGPNLDAVPPYEPYTCPKPDTKPGIVYPDATVEITTHYGPLAADQLRALQEKKARVLIHGCIKYRDLLSEKQRVSEYGTLYMATDEPVPFRIVHPYMRMK